MALGDSVKKKKKKKKKKPSKLYFPGYVKLFASVLIMHSLFCCTNQKNVLQKEITD